MKSNRTAIERLRGRVQRGFIGYPLATVIFYGPNEQRASKVAVGVINREKAPADPLERWVSETTDVRADESIGSAVLAFLDAHGVRSVVIAAGIQGCPHEEGIDYPEGATCPRCPYWAGRPRSSTGSISRRDP
ncbi:MAG TPA: hypothetical protein VMM18_06485 [Gemmatimonadaceae bacterium]|nr:hypothetical protein [Gemmatimonadaceae bacterium]